MPQKKKRIKYIPGDYKLKVKRSNTGLGLFALEEIPKDVCIVEYFGRAISKEEEYTSNSKYLFEINSRKTIDGATRQNIARYINHSCKPNSEPRIYQGRIYVLSIKKIKPGEELCYDYGKEYVNEHIKPKGCRCEKCLTNKNTPS